MDDVMKKRCNELFAMGLKFNGESYVGGGENSDINFHHTEIMCDDEQEWNSKIEKVKKELERRNLETTSTTSIEVKINDFIKESLNYSDKQISELQLQQKMAIIEMRDKAKWDEFRAELRKLDYVI